MREGNGIRNLTSVSMRFRRLLSLLIVFGLSGIFLCAVRTTMFSLLLKAVLYLVGIEGSIVSAAFAERHLLRYVLRPSRAPEMSIRDFHVGLSPREDSIRYIDARGIYRFRCRRNGRNWSVSLPPSRGNSPAFDPLSPEEAARILPRIASYLSRCRWFWGFPVKSVVTFTGDSIE